MSSVDQLPSTRANLTIKKKVIKFMEPVADDDSVSKYTSTSIFANKSSVYNNNGLSEYNTINAIGTSRPIFNSSMNPYSLDDTVVSSDLISGKISNDLRTQRQNIIKSR